MPELRSKRKSDFLQFRPYVAFTPQAARPMPAPGGLRWGRAALILGAMALLLGVAAWFTYR